MRITTETLLKIARDTVAQRTRSDRSLLAIYLTGSLLESEPLLGGTTDIDLVFIHDTKVDVEREIQRLTDQVHLDIAHHARDDYRWARSLRLHPWLGSTIVGCKIMYDPQHFLDFTQASVRSQFARPDNLIGRSRGQAEHARQMWFTLHDLGSPAGLDDIELYFKAIEHVANAVASLSGPPLTERRFLLRFPQRAEAIGFPGLYAGLVGLLGGPNASSQAMQAWLPAWQAAYLAIPPRQASPRLHAHRCPYFQRAIEKGLDSDKPQDALWPLLHTWTDAIHLLPEESDHRQAWEEALQQLGLLGEGFPKRVEALDAYLDTVEEILDERARANGVELE